MISNSQTVDQANNRQLLIQVQLSLAENESEATLQPVQICLHSILCLSQQLQHMKKPVVRNGKQGYWNWKTQYRNPDKNFKNTKKSTLLKLFKATSYKLHHGNWTR